MVLVIYRGPDGFRWRKRAENGRITDASTQGYKRYREVTANLRSNGLPCPLHWQRLALVVRRGKDRKWRWSQDLKDAE